MTKSVCNTSDVNADKFAGSEPWSVVNAGIYLHSGGAGAVTVMDFEKKLQLYIVQTLRSAAGGGKCAVPVGRGLSNTGNGSGRIIE